MAIRKIHGDGIHVQEITSTQLIAPGGSTSSDVTGLSFVAYEVTVAALNTNVVVQIDGSIDGTNFFKIPLISTPDTGIAITDHEATITANGTFILYADRVSVPEVRLNFVSESGGTAATVDSKLYARS